MLGSVYAFVMYSLLACGISDQGCPASTTIPVLILWTFVCAFFREVHSDPPVCVLALYITPSY